jgi:drug/metabolite transporter (DMT)-like permease
VGLGLASALSWGAADFGGGVTTRRAPLLGVALLVQPVGLAAAVVVALLRGEGLPEAGAASLAAVAGLAGVLGLVNLYHGLAVGRMGVVAPVTGLLAALLPVTVGILVDGLPVASVLLGIVLALVAVVLVARAPASDGARSGVQFGVAAGIGLGTLNVLISQVPESQLFGSLAIVKLSAAAVVGLGIVVRQPSWRVPRGVLAAVVLVGLLDMGGNALFVLAAHAGRLDVAAVLSSLYPVVTVLLAATILRERMAPAHLLGVAVAVIAIALIASGSAAS